MGTTRFYRLAGMLALWLMLALAWMGQAHAQAERAAHVHFASGYVAATAPGAAARQLAKGDDIFSGDRIDTAENGRVQMRFTDGGLVALMPNSTFSVDEYLHEGKSEQDASLVFGLVRGGLRTVTGTIGQVQHDQYELKTPVATLGIRGTEYIAVLNPPNTLRVHVGRGKVVITNDQGSLEVPAGRHAVVTLGSAPQFSEQPPHYQATSPMGDRLMATWQARQDPHLLDPYANMPWFSQQHFINLPASPSPTSPPGSGPQPPGTLPVTPPMTPPVTPPAAYSMGIAVPFDWHNNNLLQLWLTGPAGIDLNIDPATGITSLTPAELDLGNLGQHNVVTHGALTWGELSTGTGALNSTPLTLNHDPSAPATPYAPFVLGGLPVQALPTGLLSFTLGGATMAREPTGTMTGNLQRFNFDIDLGAGSYALDMHLATDDGLTPADIFVTTSAGSLLANSTAQGFMFDDLGTSPNGGCPSNGCALSAAGFLAGPNANQAGIIYNIIAGGGGDFMLTGAAGLAPPQGLGM